MGLSGWVASVALVNLLENRAAPFRLSRKSPTAASTVHRSWIDLVKSETHFTSSGMRQAEGEAGPRKTRRTLGTAAVAGRLRPGTAGKSAMIPILASTHVHREWRSGARSRTSPLQSVPVSGAEKGKGVNERR